MKPAAFPALARPLALALLPFALVGTAPATAAIQMEPTTPRGADEGDGPHERLVLRGATIIDGTGTPPMGPVDIVIEGEMVRKAKDGAAVSDGS